MATPPVPAGWNWASEKRLSESHRQLLDIAIRAHYLGGQARLQNERDALAHALRTSNFSHHALIVDVTASGEGLFRGASEIEMTVIAEMVYVGTDAPQLGFIPGDTKPDHAP